MALADNLVAYYNFEDGQDIGSEILSDQTLNNNDGVLINMNPFSAWVTHTGNTCGLLPDLEIDLVYLIEQSNFFIDLDYKASECEFQEECSKSIGTIKALRFGLRTLNVGDADLTLGDPINNPLFELANCHPHPHFESFANFQLYDLQCKLVIQGNKRGFCLQDSEEVIFNSGVICETYDCDEGKSQGISMGCADEYSTNTQCQILDISNTTKIPNGEYIFFAEINYDHSIIDQNPNLQESDYSNNTAFVHFEIKAGGEIEILNSGHSPLLTPNFENNFDVDGDRIQDIVDANPDQPSFRFDNGLFTTGAIRGEKVSRTVRHQPVCRAARKGMGNKVIATVCASSQGGALINPTGDKCSPSSIAFVKVSECAEVVVLCSLSVNYSVISGNIEISVPEHGVNFNLSEGGAVIIDSIAPNEIVIVNTGSIPIEVNTSGFVLTVEPGSTLPIGTGDNTCTKCKENKVEMCHDDGKKDPHNHCVKTKDIQKKLDKGDFTIGGCSEVLPSITMCHTGGMGMGDPHEHCVKGKDVQKKLDKGDYTLGSCGFIPPISDGCQCDGGIVELVVSFSGGAGQNVKAKDADVSDNGDGSYTITNDGKKLKSSTEIKEGKNKVKIHTSCSQSIGVGDVFGNFTIVSFVDKKGNVCNQEGFVSKKKSLEVDLTKVDKTQNVDVTFSILDDAGESSEVNVQVFPNPFRNETNIVVEKGTDEPIELSIYDISGRKVYSSNQYFTNQTITLGMELYPGLSLVRITHRDGTVSLKIVKFR
ncbi:MAG: T9SS type A sorting domain-containing protein [Bacteroidetes bacterium]|nr:T9SS type A sorting domain-containing protein [Bacteroidota bacterium]